jgi:hypothetical protein
MSEVVVVNDDNIVVVQENTAGVVVEETQVINVVTLGEQGPPGAPGINGSGILEFNFSYGDATPSVLAIATANKIVYSVAIHISQAFDGTNPSLSVGDLSDPDRLFSVDENIPSEVGSYTTAPAYAYATDTQLYLTITPGEGASQGRGLLTIAIEQ